MRLVLNVLSYKELPILKEMRVEFNQQGGQIGRHIGNTLVLEDEDKLVSGYHAQIIYENGQYYIKDTSSNGTYLVSTDTNLNSSQAILHNNEILRIGEYDVKVELLCEADPSNSMFDTSFPGSFDAGLSSITGPFNDQSNSLSSSSGAVFSEQPAFIDKSPLHDSFSPPPVMAVQPPPTDIAQYLQGLDSLSDLDNPIVSESGIVAENQALSHIPLINQPNFEDLFNESSPSIDLSAKPQPKVVQPSVLRNNAPLPPVVPKPSKSEAPLNEVMKYFLEGAGIKDAVFLERELSPETLRAAGALFRIMIEGLMDVLRARAESKSEFRVAVTTIRSVDNNPLKFNPDVESVLKLMIGPHNPAFINSHDAVTEAFNDIKYHQIAITAGIQAAISDILRRFDPDGFEKALGEGLVFQKKARCWELYCEKYPELRTEAIEEFFGEQFAEAYEKQMRMLHKH